MVLVNLYIYYLYILTKFFSLREMSDEVVTPAVQQRRRSNSLPIPQIEISVYQGPTSSRDSPTGSSITKDFIDLPDQSVIQQPQQVVSTAVKLPGDSISDSPQFDRRRATISPGDETSSLGGTSVRRSSEKKRRVKMADLRTLIETRMFSKSDRMLERAGLDAVVVPEKPREQPVSEHICFCNSS